MPAVTNRTPGDVHEDIDRAKCQLGFREHGVRAVLRLQVTHSNFSRPAAFSNRGSSLFGARSIATGYEQCSPFLSEGNRDCPPHSATAPCHQGALSFKSQIHDYFSPSSL